MTTYADFGATYGTNQGTYTDLFVVAGPINGVWLEGGSGATGRHEHGLTTVGRHEGSG